MTRIHSKAVMMAAIALLVFSVPVQASKIDSKIETSAQQSYVFKTYLQEDDIKIKSRDGVVTMTGVVLDESHKLLAQETVAEIPSVKSVDNQLKVKAEPVRDSDAWLVAKVKSTLLFHRSVSAKTEVDVKDGIVTLKGAAASPAQRELTTEYVKDIEGVKDVRNEMTVAGVAEEQNRSIGDKIDDSSITAQVKMTLLYHRSTSAINTRVTTKDGIVTLQGKARNTAELDLATKLANDVKGVNSVVNRMIVE
jgi:osmotically-inducible protein OsmY